LTIRSLLAAVKQKEVDERITVDEPGLVAIIDKLIKQRKDSISQFAAAGRDDLVAKETFELGVLQASLPERLSPAAVAEKVAAIVAELGASGPGDMGKVMAAAKAQLGGVAEMSTVSAAVKAALAK